MKGRHQEPDFSIIHNITNNNISTIKRSYALVLYIILIMTMIQRVISFQPIQRLYQRRISTQLLVSHQFPQSSISRKSIIKRSNIVGRSFGSTTTTTNIFGKQEKHDETTTTTSSSSFVSLQSIDIDHINTIYDVIVIGGGHAGCEAATAAARIGAKTLLITQNLDTVGELSCNPSMGGIGKGHLICEIDSLGGVQGYVADTAAIHYRLLNRKKGPAVRGPRAQMDRTIYQQSMQSLLSNYSSNLHFLQASVFDLLLEDDNDNNDISTSNNNNNNNDKKKAKIQGVIVEIKNTATNNDGDKNDKDSNTNTIQRAIEIYGRSVIITTGTFLRGVLMIGHERYSGGRYLRESDDVEPPSVGLALTLSKYQFPLNRLKTGTPARIDGNTINYNDCIIQPSDIPPVHSFSYIYSYLNQQPPNIEKGNTINCYQTSTNTKTHELVLKYENTLPQYDGLDGKGNGPRYCPSIYKKVQRFPERDSHNTFLEPEGLNTNLVYPNGMSGPYPIDIQLQILRSMKGLENVEIIKPGYDVEYDFVNPLGTIQHTMETTIISNLYMAGQICGTTGYEEAAAQGIIAGINAGKKSIDNNYKPFIIGRDEGYIGVLIDDLVTRGTTEPYRMFTSRSEYRISLRADNADLRLTQKAYDYGVLGDGSTNHNNHNNHYHLLYESYQTRQYYLYNQMEQLQTFKLSIDEWNTRSGDKAWGGVQMERRGKFHKKSAEEILLMPQITLQEVEDIIIQVQDEKLSNQLLNEEEQKSSELVTNEDSVGINDDDEEASSGGSSSPALLYTRTPSFVFDTVEATIKYQSYIRRQQKDMDSYRRAQGMRIPPDIIYSRDNLPTFSNEELEKLRTIRPNTFSDASQISGITPNSLVYLYHYINRRSKKRDEDRSTTYNTMTTSS